MADTPNIPDDEGDEGLSHLDSYALPSRDEELKTMRPYSWRLYDDDPENLDPGLVAYDLAYFRRSGVEIPPGMVEYAALPPFRTRTGSVVPADDGAVLTVDELVLTVRVLGTDSGEYEISVDANSTDEPPGRLSVVVSTADGDTALTVRASRPGRP